MYLGQGLIVGPPIAPGLSAPMDVALHANGDVLLAGYDVLSSQNFVQRLEGGFPLESPIYAGWFTVEYSPVAVLALEDGKAVLGGYDLAAGQAYLARFAADGSLDPGFGTAGVLHSGADGFPGSGLAAVVQTNGDFLLAGISSPNSEAFVLRVDADGNLDSSFGVGGVAGTGIATALGAYSPVDLLLQPDGRIVLAGYELATASNYIVRLNPDGALDTAFGSAGVSRSGIASYSEQKTAHALQSDHRLLLAGTDQRAGRAYAARFLPDGAVDTAFGDAGVTRLNFSSTMGSLGLQSDGKIVLGGWSSEMGGIFMRASSRRRW